MDFAADAVIDVIAPPPRSAARAPDPASGLSFDDHLDASEDAPEAPHEDAVKGKSDEAIAAIPQPAPAPTPSTPQQSAAVLVQLINHAEEPAAEPTPDGGTDMPAVEAASDAPAPLRAPSSAEHAELPPIAPDSSEPAAHTEPQHAVAQRTAPQLEQKLTEATEKSEAPTPVVQAQQPTAPTAPQQAGAQVVPPPVTQTQPTTAEITPPTAVMQPAERPAPPRAAAPQPGKAEAAEIEAKSEIFDAKALAQSATQKSRAENAASAPNNKSDIAPFIAGETSQSAAQTPVAPIPTSSTSAATSTHHAALDHSVARAAPAAAQVGREIVRHFNGESTRFELRLDPPELGRVEVRLEVSRDHRVTAVVAADSPQALTELARHARELEQTLQSAGLQLSDNGLSFDLRQSPGEADAETSGDNRNTSDASAEDAPAEQTIAARPIGYERWRGVRIDVMV